MKDELTVEPTIGQKTFEEIIDHPWTIKKYRNPIFFFIDPFGYSLDFDDIKDIMTLNSRGLFWRWQIELASSAEMQLKESKW